MHKERRIAHERQAEQYALGHRHGRPRVGSRISLSMAPTVTLQKTWKRGGPWIRASIVVVDGAAESQRWILRWDAEVERSAICAARCTLVPTSHSRWRAHALEYSAPCAREMVQMLVSVGRAWRMSMNEKGRNGLFIADPDRVRTDHPGTCISQALSQRNEIYHCPS